MATARAILEPSQHRSRILPTVPNDLQAFSIEFAYFPDYAGNKSYPNEFSKNLLANFKTITGVPPTVRVGGTSQDHSYYHPDQEENIQLIYANPNDDQPDTIYYGPTFFESYHTLGNVKFFHGLNLNQNHSIQILQEAAVEACTSIGPQLELFELGNEWNFAPGEYRAANYSMLDYVHEWNQKSAAVKAAAQKACPGPFPGFLAPSFVLGNIIESQWSAEEVFNLGYDPQSLTRELSFHNPPHNPPVDWDLQRMVSEYNMSKQKLTATGRLMNHTNIQESLASQIQRAKNLAYLGHPYVLGELNSIANQGITGETNTFGDALWLVDFSFWAGAHNIKRLHFHQGLDYRYASWQPILGKGQPPTTRPPYYGQIMVASALGHSHNARVVNIPLDEETESAYAIYDGDRLSKLAVMNMQAFNQTTTGIRPSNEYQFKVPGHYRQAKVERLIAPGSDATEEVTFAGISYDHDLAMGKPVVVDPKEKFVVIKDGVLRVVVPDSSAVVVSLN
ncbi:uncharacterized protein N7477_002086 [Penicillium maclennaniae]|uniref:uncharacterized protein n=1 Tax=Penicillium maclennaniae TaxID=1343394 RepID=UPI0025411F14|nr:uncharacterized protein N7477_002086 [Penicillium maclennaniae]KAJ5676453.1 hypothetical protein N7477_002086 [Penicillium maclennaniae]